MENSSRALNTEIDGVLAECFVNQIRVANRHVVPKIRTLAEAPDFDVENVIKSNTFRFPGLAEDATSKAGTFTLDATKKPKQMDSVSAEQQVMLGIYEIDADSYKVCFAPIDKSRPSEFASTRGNRQILQVWKRQKKQ